MVIKENIYIPCFQSMRTLHIYLPDTYDEEKKRYPVLYMFDGHNLFFDENATYGKSWGLKKYLDKTKRELIVVGIECNHEGHHRLEEFSPYDFHDSYVGFIQGRGKDFMDWVVSELKPWIDQQLRTKKTRAHTGIAGSSMGGLMALYTILHHNDTFSKAACLSPFLFPVTKEIKEEVSTILSKHTKLYISWGSDEFRTKLQLANASSYHVSLVRSLFLQGIDVYPNLVVKGKHNEASWEKELPICLPYLFDGE